MDDKEKRRLSLARRASELLRTDPEFTKYLAFESPDGSRPMIIALLDDRVGDIFARLAEHYPDGANVLVGSAPGGRLLNVVFRKEGSGGVPDVPFGDLPDDSPIHVESEMGMLLGFLMLRPADTSIRCRPIERFDVALELVGAPV